jgi:hypothetical protein
MEEHEKMENTNKTKEEARLRRIVKDLKRVSPEHWKRTERDRLVSVNNVGGGMESVVEFEFYYVTTCTPEKEEKVVVRRDKPHAYTDRERFHLTKINHYKFPIERSPKMTYSFSGIHFKEHDTPIKELFDTLNASYVIRAPSNSNPLTGQRLVELV